MKDLYGHLTSRNLYYGLLHVAVIALAIQVVILSRQSRQPKEGGSRVTREQLKIGDTLDLSQLTPVQKGTVLDSIRGPHILFVMTTTCPFCREIIPAWKKLAETVGVRMPVAAISLDARDATLKYAKEHEMSLPFFVCTDVERFREVNKLRGVPETIIIDQNRKVLKVWLGKFEENDLKEVAMSTSDNTIHQTHQNKMGGQK